MRSRYLEQITGIALVGGALGCNPYEGYGKGNHNLGPVDPASFPPASLGTGGNRMQSGAGTFAETTAYAGGAAIGYYSYPFPAAAAPAAGAPPPPADTPIRIAVDGRAVATFGDAYVFDPTDASPFPASPTCNPPAGYSYDRRRDAIRLDEQGNVFSQLPTATWAVGVLPTTTYRPIVAEVPLSASGSTCQDVKTADAAKTRGSTRSGKYLAWAVIDPGAGVYRSGQIVPARGQAPVCHEGPRTAPTATWPCALISTATQKWGWFNQYFLAYLEGGYLPTETVTVMEGMNMRMVERFKAQKLYHPISIGVPPPASMPMAMPTVAPGAIGAGYDVVEAKRGDAGYSPVCEVFTYDTAVPDMMGMPGTGTPPLPATMLPRSADEIVQKYMATLRPAATRFVFCLQADPQPPPAPCPAECPKPAPQP